jgi:polyisoprenyl-phosphate glycosyltransferase
MNTKISVVTPTFNEAKNIVELCDRIATVMRNTRYEYEHIVIDNASTDETVEILRRRAASDRNLKIIVNTRNFGHIRSPYHALFQATGDAVILMAADLQDPPEILPDLISQWTGGFKIVMAIKQGSEEKPWKRLIRKMYYKLLNNFSESALVPDANGGGLYDAEVINILKQIKDPNPYFRGLVCEIGFPIAKVEFFQSVRKKGSSSQNFFSLYDLAMLAIVKHSKLPLRLLTMTGVATAFISALIGTFYLGYKILFWSSFSAGQAPLIIGLFFFISILMILIGLMGEYILSIHDQVRNLPLVIEKERINFTTAKSEQR